MTAMASRNKHDTSPGRRRNKLAEQWAAHRISMLESPAWQVLSLSARRVLDRLEIEHAHHGGRENGRLPVTFEQFCAYGIDRHAIAPAIRECGALGFLEVTEAGRGGNAEFRRPNRFRLTYIQGNLPPTDEWREIKTIEAAQALAIDARRASARRPAPNGAAPHGFRRARYPVCP
jgi:hypothetical protein